jgi:hypothetical protein
VCIAALTTLRVQDEIELLKAHESTPDAQLGKAEQACVVCDL